MKKVLQLFVILLFVLQTNLFPQSPIVQQIIDSVNIDSLIFFVKELSGEVPTIINGTSQTILSRHRDQPGNALAETYIKQKLESYGLPVSIQNYSTTGNNVLATQLGTIFPNKKFIICAHYDAMPEGPIAPGADDNGTGTAAVIESARILTQYAFPFTIVYAVWDEEEQALFGSTYYADQAAAAGDSILGVINLEMLGWENNNDGVCYVEKRNIVHSVQLYDNLQEVNNQYGMNLNITLYPIISDSDHAPFWYNGYDAIVLVEENEQDLNIYYHTINDRVQYLNKPYYLRMTKLALGTLAFLALYLNFDIIHTPITSVIPTQATNTNIFINTAMQIGTGSFTPRMYYRAKDFGGSYGGFNEVVGTSTGGGNYTFDVPELPNGTLVQYYLAAQDENSTIVKTSPIGGNGFNPPGSTPPGTFYEFLVADLKTVWSDSANNMTNWTPTGGWNITTEKFVSPPTSFTDSPGGSYTPNTITTLRYNNQIQVLNAYNTFLEFDSQWAIEYNYDYGQVQISTDNGTSWISLAGQYTIPGIGSPQPNGEPIYDGNQADWIHEVIDISNYANRQISLRFLLKSDDIVNWDGWYVDNVKVSVFATILAEQPYIDRTYARKNIDSVLFRIKLLNLYTHQFTSHLIYANANKTDIDSLILLDDGVHGDSLANDGIYGGYISPRQIEDFYSVSVSTFDQEINKYISSPELFKFTTAPLLIDSTQFTAISNNRYTIKPFLKNAGTDQTIKNIVVKITCNDAWVKAIPFTERICPNLLPGQNAGITQPFAVSYDSATFPGYFNLKFSISSYGWSYWEMDTTIIVKPLDVEEEVNEVPTEFLLSQNFPNPFNPRTKISWQSPVSSRQVLKIFDVIGNEIATLVDEEKEAGYHSIDFNASDLPSGVYFYQLKTVNFIATKKMLLLR